MPAAGEGADAVDAVRVEQVVLALGDLRLDGRARRGRPRWPGPCARPGCRRCGPRCRPCGRLGGTKTFSAGGRVEDLDPGPVEGGVLRVVAGLLDPPLPDLLGVEARRRVEDGDPVAHQLAVGDHRQLHGLDAVEVDHALLVGGHQVGDADHGDRVDGLEAAEAGAVGRVADVVVGRQPRSGPRRPPAGEGDRARRRPLQRRRPSAAPPGGSASTGRSPPWRRSACPAWWSGCRTSPRACCRA